MLPPNYADGVGEPRGAVGSNSLPSASTVSSLVHRPTYKADLNFTMMLAVWGQFIDHDITAIALNRGKDGTTIACCSSKLIHPECFPVWEKHSDGHESCREVVRSAPAATCCFDRREQICSLGLQYKFSNQITKFTKLHFKDVDYKIWKTFITCIRRP